MSIQNEITRLANAKAAIKAAIEEKGVSVSDGTTLDGMAAAISQIAAGVTVQKASGTFTTNTSGAATVTCGFQPDLVAFTKNETDNGSKCVTAASFADFGASGFKCSMWNSSGYIYDFTPTRTTTGFSVSVTTFNGSTDSATRNTSFTYTAYKFI